MLNLNLRGEKGKKRKKKKETIYQSYSIFIILEVVLLNNIYMYVRCGRKDRREMHSFCGVTRIPLNLQ